MSAALSHRTPVAPAAAHDPDDADFLATMGRHVREARERRGLPRKAVSQTAGVWALVLYLLPQGAIEFTKT